MKLPCRVIEDMLPMYYDKVCSEESATLIEEHLKHCPRCSQILTDLSTDIAVSKESIDDIKPLKKIQKNYKRKKLYWLLAISLVLLLLPVAFLAGNEHGEQSEQSDEYPVEDAISSANTFMECLKEGDYAKAYTFFDFEDVIYYAQQDGVDDEVLANFEADGLERFCEVGAELEDLGGIESWEFLETRASGFDASGDRVYYIYYRVKLAERFERLDVTVGEKGITNIGLTIARTKHPLSQLCYYDRWVIDNYLYRNFDYDTREYIYHNE